MHGRLLLARRWRRGVAAPSLAHGGRHDQDRRCWPPSKGAFTVLGQDSMRGADLAFKEPTAGRRQEDRGHQGLVRRLAGQRRASAARKLVEQDGVQILIGPLSGDEGLAIKDYAKTQPNVTFINGTSAAQDTTLRDPAPNFFRFTTDGAQWMAGLGDYAYNDKGYKKVVDGRRGLFVPVHAGVRLHGGVLQGRRPCAEEILGADRQQGLLLGRSPRSPTISMRSTSRSAAPTPSTSSPSTSRRADRRR